MKRSRYFLGLLTVALFLLPAAGVVKADLADPKIALGPTGSSGTFTQTQCFPADGGVSACSFTTDANGMTTIDIINNTGNSGDFEDSEESGTFIIKDIVNIEAPLGSLGSFTCPTEGAPGWSGTASGNSCIFTGGFISPGVKYGLTFSLFAPNTKFFFDLRDVTSSTPPVPEPGTMILLGTGLASVAAGRKRLKRAKHVV